MLARLNKAKCRFHGMIAAEEGDDILLRGYVGVSNAREDLKKMNRSTLHISLRTFNVNVYSD